MIISCRKRDISLFSNVSKLINLKLKLASIEEIKFKYLLVNILYYDDLFVCNEN